MLKTGEMVSFDTKKQFKHVKQLGSGGTGDTFLFEDITTNMLFAIKKYSPKNLNYIDDNYKRFVDEIKILLKISHPNIVRIYNYYLYPEQKVGYLQMEYIDGVPINEYELGFFVSWEDIFSDVVNAFYYLEKNNILHRDIRASNILVDKDDNVKIIDFGFGKELIDEEKEGKSILLNWPATELPEEVVINKIYNHQTEIYFVGKLFQHILSDDLNSFKYKHIINKMIKVNVSERYKSFWDVLLDISKDIFGEINFSDREKKIYQAFANSLCSHIISFKQEYTPITDISIILTKLVSLIRNSSLEEYLQDNRKLINCFVEGSYKYMTDKNIKILTITDFYKLINGYDSSKQKIVMDNIFTRLACIEIDIFDDEQMPF